MLGKGGTGAARENPEFGEQRVYHEREQIAQKRSRGKNNRSWENTVYLLGGGGYYDGVARHLWNVEQHSVMRGSLQRGCVPIVLRYAAGTIAHEKGFSSAGGGGKNSGNIRTCAFLK